MSMQRRRFEDEERNGERVRRRGGLRMGTSRKRKIRG